MGKLGAATGDPTAVMADVGGLDDVVNGPEDLSDWDAIAWRRQEEQVRRLRQRIFKAVRRTSQHELELTSALAHGSGTGTIGPVARLAVE